MFLKVFDDHVPIVLKSSEIPTCLHAACFSDLTCYLIAAMSGAIDFYLFFKP